MRPWVEAKARLKLPAIALVTGEAGNRLPTSKGSHSRSRGTAGS